jgi:hypothetical protein
VIRRCQDGAVHVDDIGDKNSAASNQFVREMLATAMWWCHAARAASVVLWSRSEVLAFLLRRQMHPVAALDLDRERRTVARATAASPEYVVSFG